jgi:hypothetical protein
MIDVNGEVKSMMDWANQLGINYFTVKTRIRRGWSPQKALLCPISVQ